MLRLKSQVKEALQESTSSLDKKLWKIFSEFIRVRDSFESNGDLYFTCISCGETKHVKESQAGHYFSRTYKAIKYDERNVHSQCSKCNIFSQGAMQGYREGLIKKCGIETLKILEIKKKNTCHWTKFEYQALINEYTKKLKELKNQRGII